MICLEQNDFAVFYVAHHAFGGHADIGCHAASCAFAIERIRKRIRRIVRDSERFDVYISYLESALVIGHVDHIFDVCFLAYGTLRERMRVNFCVRRQLAKPCDMVAVLVGYHHAVKVARFQAEIR